MQIVSWKAVWRSNSSVGSLYLKVSNFIICADSLDPRFGGDVAYIYLQQHCTAVHLYDVHVQLNTIHGNLEFFVLDIILDAEDL